jgi:hypothetical protein
MTALQVDFNPKMSINYNTSLSSKKWADTNNLLKPYTIRGL